MRSYTITRRWHENTSKANRRDIVAEGLGHDQVIQANLNAEGRNPEAAQ